MGPLSVLDDHSRYLLCWRPTAARRRARARATGRSISTMRSSRGDVDGPWHSVVGSAVQSWAEHSLSLWLMRQGIRLNWSGIRHPQTQGKVERFHGSLQRALARRGCPRQQPQAWLDDVSWEHNHVRPHEALKMKTPASVWQPSRANTIRSHRLGVSYWSAGVESGSARKDRSARTEMENQQSRYRGMGPSGAIEDV